MADFRLATLLSQRSHFSIFPLVATGSLLPSLRTVFKSSCGDRSLAQSVIRTSHLLLYTELQGG